eukprot:m.229729 g.229729  ORF g.229729 m.229729 type:complete len:292 (-) comp17815_c0_seq1:32-907(-)
MAVVTGAANGIGKAVCRILAGLPTATSPASYGGRSAGIVCVDYDEKRLHETTQELQHDLHTHHAQKDKDGHLPKIIALPGDVSEEALVKKAVNLCVKEFGRIDKMIANAGISGPIVDIFHETPEDFEKIFKINVFGVFYCIKYAALAMQAQEIRAGALDRGAIVAVASVAGIGANAGPVAYSASKAAVINMVKTSAVKLGFDGPGKHIRVNAVCPGLVETNMTHFVFERARKRGATAKLGEIWPSMRAGTASETAAAIAFLASDQASMITGQSLAVDGGLTAGLPFSGARF